jgi:hypothetical protein
VTVAERRKRVPTRTVNPENCSRLFILPWDEPQVLPLGQALLKNIPKRDPLNRRSLGCAPPDFLALANFMRLSSRKGARAATSSATWQEIRVGMTKGRANVSQHLLPLSQHLLPPCHPDRSVA